MSAEDDFWAMAQRMVDRMCVTCSQCGNRKLEDHPCENCSAPPRPGLLRAKPLQEELAKRQKRGDITWEELGRRSRLSARTILRVMASDFVTVKVADMVCTALEIHPTEFWPAEWARQ